MAPKGFLKFIVDDDKEFKIKLSDLNIDNWPFYAPLSTRHKNWNAGCQTYVPICYKRYIHVSYFITFTIPHGILHMIAECSHRDRKFLKTGKLPQGLACKIDIYLNISKHKFPPLSQTEPFHFHKNRTIREKEFQKSASTLSRPVENSVTGKECSLNCVNISSQSNIVISRINSPGVIFSFRIQVTEDNKVPFDWNSLVLSMHFDRTPNVQVQEIPLGVLFGASQPNGQSLNDFNGASIGRKKLRCFKKFTNENGSSYGKVITDWVGYISLPMPFWRSAEVSLKNLDSSRRFIVCVEMVLMPNIYTSATTGYFSMQTNQYTGGAVERKDIFSVQNAWGHLVGLIGELTNYSPSMILSNKRGIRNHVEADILFFIDGRKAASMAGSGFEDYFGYGHEAIRAENTTYAFVGCPYGTKFDFLSINTLSRHFYRLHSLDPVPFHNSITIGIEGYHEDVGKRTAKRSSIGVDKFYSLKKANKEFVSAFIVVYYAKSDSRGLLMTDEIILYEQRSRVVNYNSSHNESYRPTLKPFKVENCSYLGDVITFETFTKQGYEFKVGDGFNITVKIHQDNKGAILRRDFHTIPFTQWEEKARISVDGVDHSIWMFGKGTVHPRYTLRQGDLLLNPAVTRKKSSITITIMPLTLWRDISYQVFSIL